MTAAGADTNVALWLKAKGSSSVWVLNEANSAIVEFKSPTTGSLANYATVQGATTGNAVRLGATGNDTDVHLNLAPKGAGTVQANGVPVATRLTNTATLDFGSASGQSFADLTVTVTGAATGDSVSLGVPTAAVTAGIIYSTWVSATNTVTVRAHNYTAGPLDPASGTFKATIVR